MTLNLGVTFFRFPETEEERKERYEEDQRCYCGLDWHIHSHVVTETGLDAVDDYIDTELDNGSMYR